MHLVCSITALFGKSALSLHVRVITTAGNKAMDSLFEQAKFFDASFSPVPSGAHFSQRDARYWTLSVLQCAPPRSKNAYAFLRMQAG